MYSHNYCKSTGWHESTPPCPESTPAAMHDFCFSPSNPISQLGTQPTSLDQRVGTVVDPEGNTWMIATHIAEPTPQEMAKKMKEMTKQTAGASSGS